MTHSSDNCDRETDRQTDRQTDSHTVDTLCLHVMCHVTEITLLITKIISYKLSLTKITLSHTIDH